MKLLERLIALANDCLFCLELHVFRNSYLVKMTISRILKDRSFLLSIILTLIFCTTGFCFLHFGWSNYGWMLFVLFPVVLGISIGALPNKALALTVLVMTFILFLIGLIVLGLEGIACGLMILPIALPLIFLGAIITHLAERYQKIKASENLPVLLLPLFIFLFGAPIEKALVKSKQEIISIKSEIVLPYSNYQVYDAIKSVDTLVADKTFLMHLDLPVPKKCVLEKEAVGGLRTCYFSGGKIEERITKLQRGKVLQMDVIKYELTGRKWLGFKEAIYLFDSLDANHSKLTRITTYTSLLKPRFYWEPLEKSGIEQEHEYVFANLKNDLQRKYGKQ